MQKGSQARPTTDKLRSSIFSILHNVEGQIILDSFAGSGALGIEAYSRGASYVDFIDTDTSSIEINAKLIEKGKYSIFKGDFLKVYKNLTKKYDIIFLDPPYGKYSPNEILNICSTLLSDNGIIIYEEYFKTDFSAVDESIFELEKEKRYGDTSLKIYKAK